VQCQRVHDSADILDDETVEQFDIASSGVDGNMRRGRSVGVGQPVVVAERGCDLQAVRRELCERERASIGSPGASIRQFDLFGGASQSQPSSGADLDEQGIRRLEHRRPAEHRRAGRERAVALIEKRCRTVHYAHLPERQPERIRRDLRHHRFEALSDRSRTDIDRHGAICLEIEPRSLLRTCSAALDKARDGDAVVAPVNRAALQCALFLPAELGEAAFEGFAIVAAVAFGIAGRTDRLQPRQRVRHLAGADQVAPTHLGAVDGVARRSRRREKPRRRRP